MVAHLPPDHKEKIAEIGRKANRNVSFLGVLLVIFVVFLAVIVFYLLYVYQSVLLPLLELLENISPILAPLIFLIGVAGVLIAGRDMSFKMMRERLVQFERKRIARREGITLPDPEHIPDTSKPPFPLLPDSTLPVLPKPNADDPLPANPAPTDPLALNLETLGEPLRVLFLAANPPDAPYIDTKAEYDVLRNALKTMLGVGQYSVIYEPESAVGDLGDLLHQHRPHILHFVGHSTADGSLHFESPHRATHPVDADTLAERLALWGQPIRCVLLNACWSDTLAQTLLQKGNVPVVIGMAQRISEADAHAFTEGFYKALGANKTLAEAFRNGGNQLACTGSNAVPHRLTGSSSTSAPSLTLSEAVHTHLTTLELLFAEIVDRYVELSGSQRTRASLPTSWQIAIDPIKYAREMELELRGDYRARNAPAEHQGDPVRDVRDKLTQLQAPRAVLLGDPGMGKSWTLFRVALDYANRWRADSGSTALVPLVLRLQEFKGVHPGAKNEQRPQTFPEFVERNLGLLQPFYPDTLPPDRILFLCDALNEMPPRAPDGRDLIAEVRDFLRDKPHFILSCREHEYNNALGDLRPLDEITLRPLTLPQIRHLLSLYLLGGLGEQLWKDIGGTPALESFWRQVIEYKEKGEEYFWKGTGAIPSYTRRNENDAWGTMHTGARLMLLCRKPFTARLLCDVYKQNRALPANRAALFQSFVDELLRTESGRDIARGIPWREGQMQAIDSALERFARVLQKQKTTVLPRAAALQAFRYQISDKGTLIEQLPANLAADYLTVAISANLLTQEGDNLRFAHQLIQEYFAVRELMEAVEKKRPATDFLGDSWWDASNWRETFAMLAETYGGIEGTNKAARWLAPTSPEIALDLFRDEARQLNRDAMDADTRAALIAAARAKTTEPHPHGRAAAYRVLALFDADTRPGIGVRPDGLPDILWCPVPEGEFSWQDGKATLDYDYYIAKYPLTYAQYQPFIDADGYEQSEWWKGLNRPKPVAQHFQYSNHPRDNLSWWEAVAYTRWLTAQWRRRAAMVLSDVTSNGDEDTIWQGITTGALLVSLPTEEEWEKVARGSDGRTYPWGPEYVLGYANIRNVKQDAFLRHTSAVGIYPPESTSPYGAMDIVGNVLEWTLSTHPNVLHARSLSVGDVIEDKGVRVMRGGSWDTGLDSSEATFRKGVSPSVGGYNDGLRLCLVPAHTRALL